MVANQTCFSCDIRHAFGAGNGTQCGGDEGRIALVERRLEVSRHVFLGLEVVCGIPECRFSRG